MSEVCLIRSYYFSINTFIFTFLNTIEVGTVEAVWMAEKSLEISLPFVGMSWLYLSIQELSVIDIVITFCRMLNNSWFSCSPNWQHSYKAVVCLTWWRVCLQLVLRSSRPRSFRIRSHPIGTPPSRWASCGAIPLHDPCKRYPKITSI